MSNYDTALSVRRADQMPAGWRADHRVELPDLANKNREHPVKFECQINNKSFRSVSIARVIFGINLC